MTDLVGCGALQMTETLAVEGSGSEAASAEYLRAGLQRVNSLLSKVRAVQERTERTRIDCA